MMVENIEMNARGMTKPLSPIPDRPHHHHHHHDEKRAPGVRGPNINGDRIARPRSGFWQKLRCW